MEIFHGYVGKETMLSLKIAHDSCRVPLEAIIKTPFTTKDIFHVLSPSLFIPILFNVIVSRPAHVHIYKLNLHNGSENKAKMTHRLSQQLCAYYVCLSHTNASFHTIGTWLISTLKVSSTKTFLETGRINWLKIYNFSEHFSFPFRKHSSIIFQFKEEVPRN